MLKLAYVHLYNMRTSSQGQLSYGQEFNEWVGTVAYDQPATCKTKPNGTIGWDGSHVHYARATNFGTNVHNGASGFGALNSWPGSDEVFFVAYGH